MIYRLMKLPAQASGQELRQTQGKAPKDLVAEKVCVAVKNRGAFWVAVGQKRFWPGGLQQMGYGSDVWVHVIRIRYIHV